MSVSIVVPLFLFTVGMLRICELFWLKRTRESGKMYAKWTLSALSMGYVLMMICTVLEYIFIKRNINIVISVIGFIVVIVRFPVKFWAARTLGKYWSMHIEMREDQKLIKAGPYKYLRHPVYFVAIIDLVGVPLLANSYYTIFSASMVLFFLVIIRMNIEEKMLIEKFGDEYIKYKQETFALLPISKQEVSKLIESICRN